MARVWAIPLLSTSATPIRGMCRRIGSVVDDLYRVSDGAVGEGRTEGARTGQIARGTTREELRTCHTDVVTGMFASKMSQLPRTRLRRYVRSRALGRTGCSPTALIGTGMLAVPVLAGSCAYAIAEASAWRAIGG